MEEFCSSSTHQDAINAIETVMHRGSDFQREEVLKVCAVELARLPLELYETFMMTLFSELKKNDTKANIDDYIELTEDVEDVVPVGSEYVDDVLMQEPYTGA